jgi:trans-aconitate methyltransferase
LKLHENHQLLYETILKINPQKLMEIGCGAGDHLRNLRFLNPEFQLVGVDRSSDQLAFLKERNPQLINNVELLIKDVSLSHVDLPTAELTFSQAVFMHITEKENRFYNSLVNSFNHTTDHFVLVENWTQHNFYEAITSITNSIPQWKKSKMYYSFLPDSPSSRILIVSKKDLDFYPLINYRDLVLDKKIEEH